MITENTKEFWNGVAEKPDHLEYILPGRTEAEFWEEGKAQADVLQPMIKPDDTVLDFGCGVGRVLRYIKARHLIGVDACKKWLDIAARYGIETVQSDGLKIDLPDNTADFIYSLMVFQHTPKDRHPAMIAELFRVLKPGGKMIIQFPRDQGGFYHQTPFVNVYSKAEMYSLGYNFKAGIGEPVEISLQKWQLVNYSDGHHQDREWLLMIEK